MKILLVIHKYWEPDRSGTLTYYSNLLKGLEKNHELVVFMPVRKKDINKNAKNKNNFVVPLNYTINPAARFPIYDPRSLYDKDIEHRFRLLIKQYQPDIIHFQHLLGLPFSCLEIAIRSKVPVLFNIHDFWTLCPRVHLYNTDNEICEDYFGGIRCAYCIKRNLGVKENLKTLPRDIFCAKGYQHSFFRWRYRCSISLLKQVWLITPSNFVKDIYVNLGINDQKIILLPMSLDLPSPRKENRAIGDRINFGYVGVLQNHKGIEDLVRAFVTVNKGRAQLLIYGEGDRLRLTKQIPPSELQQIQFKGIFGKAEKTAVYESIDFLIVPSRCYETFSFVAREALYYGKPVIAPAHSVFLEIVKPRENGLLFSPLNWRSLSRTLEDVITQNIRIDSGRIESKMPSFDEHICQLVSVYQSFENKR